MMNFKAVFTKINMMFWGFSPKHIWNSFVVHFVFFFGFWSLIFSLFGGFSVIFFESISIGFIIKFDFKCFWIDLFFICPMFTVSSIFFWRIYYRFLFAYVSLGCFSSWFFWYLFGYRLYIYDYIVGILHFNFYSNICFSMLFRYLIRSRHVLQIPVLWKSFYIITVIICSIINGNGIVRDFFILHILKEKKIDPIFEIMAI